MGCPYPELTLGMAYGHSGNNKTWYYGTFYWVIQTYLVFTIKFSISMYKSIL